ATLAHVGEGVRVIPPEAFGPALEALGAARRAVQVEPSSAAAWIAQRLEPARARNLRGADPRAPPQAIKNEAGLRGAAAVPERDGAALCRFLAWIAREVPAGRLTEVGVAQRLDRFRAEEEAFRDTSFPTISGGGPNGAIVHYRATPETDRALRPGML